MARLPPEPWHTGFAAGIKVIRRKRVVRRPYWPNILAFIFITAFLVIYIHLWAVLIPKVKQEQELYRHHRQDYTGQ